MYLQHVFKIMVLSLVVTLSSWSVWAEPHSDIRHDPVTQLNNRWSIQTTFDNHWLIDEDQFGVLRSEIESYIGTEKHNFYLKLESEKIESEDAELIARAMYSYHLDSVGLAQVGARYRHKKVENVYGNLENFETLDAVFGLQELETPYFEAETYLFLGENQYVMSSFEIEKHLKLTENIIVKPYVEMAVVWNDDSQYAQKNGLSEIGIGLETRYQVNN